MFEHASISGATEYVLQVAEDKNGPDFEHPLINRKDSSRNHDQQPAIWQTILVEICSYKVWSPNLLAGAI